MDHGHDIEKLAIKIKRLVAEIDIYAGDDRWNVLLEIIHKQGWTKPAEYRLVDGIVENMTEQMRVMTHLKDTLFEGSRMVLDKRVEKREL